MDRRTIKIKFEEKFVTKESGVELIIKLANFE
jgi:hypothetical protein